MQAACQPKREGHPALHSAVAASRNEEIIQEVIKASPSVNIPNHNGNTPLHLAAQRCKRPETIHLLLSQGPDLIPRNEKGLTPLESGKIWNRNKAVLNAIANDFQNWREQIKDGATFLYIPVRLCAYNDLWVRGEIPVPPPNHAKIVESPPLGAKVLDTQSGTTYPAPATITVAPDQRRKAEELLRILEPSTFYPLQAATIVLPTGETCFLITKDTNCAPVEMALLEHGLGPQGEAILKLDQEDINILKGSPIPFYNIHGDRL